MNFKNSFSLYNIWCHVLHHSDLIFYFEQNQYKIFFLFTYLFSFTVSQTKLAGDDMAMRSCKWIQIMIVCTHPTLCYGQDSTQNQYFGSVLLVWIQSFPFPASVAIPRLKIPICPTNRCNNCTARDENVNTWMDLEMHHDKQE